MRCYTLAGKCSHCQEELPERRRALYYCDNCVKNYPPYKRNPTPYIAGEYIKYGRDRVRERVRTRDNHKCQDCGKDWKENERRFDVHHLNGMCGKLSRSYDRIANLATMITLCHKCHFNRPEHKTKTSL